MKRTIIAVGAALALVIAGVGVALASIPDTTGRVHMCYDTWGSVTVINTPVEVCPAGTTEILLSNGIMGLDEFNGAPCTRHGRKGTSTITLDAYATASLRCMVPTTLVFNVASINCGVNGGACDPFVATASNFGDNAIVTFSNALGKSYSPGANALGDAILDNNAYYGTQISPSYFCTTPNTIVTATYTASGSTFPSATGSVKVNCK